MNSLFRPAVLLLAFSTFFISCKKNDDDPKPAQPHQKQCYLQKKVNNNPGNYTVNIYTADMRIDSVLSYNNGNKLGASKYSYNAAGKVVKIEFYLMGDLQAISAIEYNGDNNISKITNMPPEGQGSEHNSYTLYSYNDKKQISKIQQFGMTFSGEMQELSQTLYTWDGNGNIIRADEYGRMSETEFRLYATTEYAYDNKLNSFHQSPDIITNIPYAYSKNNVIKETKTEDGTVMHTITNSNIYFENYITSRTSTYTVAGSSGSYSEFYEYLCK